MLRGKKRLLGLAVIIITVTFSYLLIKSIPSNDDNKLETLLFLGNKNIAPLVYEENGIVKGVVVDIVKALEEKIDYKIQVQAIEWQKAQDKVCTGEADAVIQINPSQERARLYDFTDELLKSEFSIFTNSDDFSIKTVYDLKDRSVGVEDGGYAYNLLNRYDVIDIVTIPNTLTGFQMIKAGHLDAIVVDRWIGEYELARSHIKKIQIVEDPIETHYSRIAVKKGNKELLHVINSGLKEIKDDNTMNDIISSWRGKNVIYFTVDKITGLVLSLAVGIIIFILFISLFLVRRYKKLSEKLEKDVKDRTKELYETNELLRKANMELERISRMDKLTGIYNRRYFDESIEKAWRIAMRESQPLALIMIDIDKFKIYNDTYGHLAGDQCLEIIAKEIKKSAKISGNFVARFGGEEFVVLLSNTSKDGAIKVAEEIRQNIEELKINHRGIEIRVTVSLGVASIIPDKSMNPSDLLSAADHALYQAKEAGRNTVVPFKN